MSDDLDLQEVQLVVDNFVEKYGGDWILLNAEVESIGRTDEEEKDGWGYTALGNIHLVIASS